MKNIATIKYNCSKSGNHLITKVLKNNNITIISPYYVNLKRNQIKRNQLRINNQIFNLMSSTEEMSSNSFKVFFNLENSENSEYIDIYPGDLCKFEYMQDDDSIITFEGNVVNISFRDFKGLHIDIDVCVVRCTLMIKQFIYQSITT